MKGEVLV